MSSPQAVLFDMPGPKARARHRILTVVGILLLVGVAWAVVGKLASTGQLESAKWTPFVQGDTWTAYLIPGLIGTLKAAALAVVLAFAFGIAFGVGRLSPSVPVRWVCSVIVEFFRSVPVLLMMIFTFFFFVDRELFVGQTASFAAVVTALTLYNGSVIAELVRSGVHGLPKGQAEAGMSIGLTEFQVLRSIQLPQALTAMLPALVSQLVVALKDTALGYQILYLELLNWSKTLGSAYGNTVPAYLFAAVLFILLNYSLSKLAQYIEQRLKRGGRTSLNAELDEVAAEEAGTSAPASAR